MASRFEIPAALPLEFTVDGERYTLPDLATRALIDAYTTGNPLAVVPALVAEGEELAARLWDPRDEFDLSDCEHAALEVAGEVAGCEFHPAARLLAAARQNWLIFDGWCVQQGFSPLHEPIGRVVAASYAWRAAMCSKESELAKLDNAVFAPVTASVTGRHVHADRPEWSDEREAAAWQAAFAQFGTSA